MPLYEYKCASCGDVFEVMQKFSDEPLTIHEGCGGAVERIISAPAIQFKGSGWYITDYARAGSGKDTQSKDAPSKDAAGKEPAAKDSSTTASKNGEPAPASSAKSDKPATTPSSSETKK
jgi:putative FmdB family regulatory protein